MYNKDIFKKYNLQTPKTFSEFENVVKVIKSHNITPISVGAKDGWPGAMMVEGLAYSTNPKSTQEIVEGKGKFTDKAYTTGATETKKLLDMGAFTKNVALTGVDAADPWFESGKAAMLAEGSWALLSMSNKSRMGDKVGFFYYPVANKSQISEYGKNVAGGPKQNGGFMVNANTKNPKIAAKVAQAMAEMRCKYVYQMTGNPFVEYDAKKLGWKAESKTSADVTKLATDSTKFDYMYGFIQDVMPTAAATAAVGEHTSHFFTNSADFPVSKYLPAMNKAAKEE